MTTDKKENLFEKCKGCLCDVCGCNCQGCPCCIHAEYSEEDWDDMYTDDCEGHDSHHIEEEE